MRPRRRQRAWALVGASIAGLSALLTGCSAVDRGRCERDHAASACERACRRGVVGEGGCRTLGDLYATGDRVGRSLPFAAAQFERGCEGGDAEACRRLEIVQQKITDLSLRLPSPGETLGGALEPKPARPVPCPAIRALEEPRELSPELIAPSATILQEKCGTGDGRACTSLGQLFAGGGGVPLDQVRAAALYRTACELHDPASCAALGEAYETGRGVAADAATAATYYQRGCTGESGLACAKLGEMSLGGRAGAPPPSAGLGFLQKGCDGGEAWACVRLADALVHSENSAQLAVMANNLLARTRGMDELRCGRGDYATCVELGDRRLQPEVLGALGADDRADASTDEDPAGAEALFKRACDGGYAPGCGRLMSLYLRLDSRAKGEAVEARARAACDAGQIESCGALVGALSTSARASLFSTEADRGAALLARACELNIGPACLASAKLEGVEPAAAAGALSRACRLGYGDGCQQLIARQLRDRARDDEKLAEVRRWACEIGVFRECERLAAMHLDSPGGAKDEACVGALFDRSCAKVALSPAADPAPSAAGCEKAGDRALTRSPPEPARAAELYRISCYAERSVSAAGRIGHACSRLGAVYDEGIGVPRDEAWATELFAIACSGHDGLGCRKVGERARDGRGLPVDPDRARQLLARGCRLDDRPSCELLTNLGGPRP